VSARRRAWWWFYALAVVANSIGVGVRDRGTAGTVLHGVIVLASLVMLRTMSGPE